MSLPPVNLPQMEWADFETRIPATKCKEALGICRKTLTNWQQRGLRCFKLGRDLYTSKAAVLDFMRYVDTESVSFSPSASLEASRELGMAMH